MTGQLLEYHKIWSVYPSKINTPARLLELKVGQVSISNPLTDPLQIILSRWLIHLLRGRIDDHPAGAGFCLALGITTYLLHSLIYAPTPVGLHRKVAIKPNQRVLPRYTRQARQLMIAPDLQRFPNAAIAMHFTLRLSTAYHVARPYTLEPSNPILLTGEAINIVNQ